jgi:catechol 2,3-dioxygenase-like lactoylglutathione lyase family enzyme
MEGFVAQKLNDFETGKISRRKLIEMLTFAATTAYAADSAQAQAENPLKAQLINHFSYSCPDFRVAADWYSKVLNLDQVGTSDHDTAIPFGKKDDKPYGVTANDVPLTHLIIRNADRDPAARPPGAAPRQTANAVIDHICFTVADFNKDRAKAELTRLGVKNVRQLDSGSIHMDDPYGFDIQIAGLEHNALTAG